MIGRLRTLFSAPVATRRTESEPEPPPEWGVMLAREPRLAELEAEIRAVRDHPGGRGFCRNAVWWGYVRDGGACGDSFHRRLGLMVGRGARRRSDPLLNAPGAFPRAFDYLYRLLPRCRNCYCAERPGQGGPVTPSRRMP